jgi:hypothetical protein
LLIILTGIEANMEQIVANINADGKTEVSQIRLETNRQANQKGTGRQREYWCQNTEGGGQNGKTPSKIG